MLFRHFGHNSSQCFGMDYGQYSRAGPKGNRLDTREVARQSSTSTLGGVNADRSTAWSHQDALRYLRPQARSKPQLVIARDLRDELEITGFADADGPAC